jgi:hypothetical protein
MATRKFVSKRPALKVGSRKISESKVRDVILEEIALEMKANQLQEAILREGFFGSMFKVASNLGGLGAKKVAGAADAAGKKATDAMAAIKGVVNKAAQSVSQAADEVISSMKDTMDEAKYEIAKALIEDAQGDVSAALSKLFKNMLAKGRKEGLDDAQVGQAYMAAVMKSMHAAKKQ